MKPFKFFNSDTLPEVDLEMVSREVQRIVRSPEYIPAGVVYVPHQIPEGFTYIDDQITESHVIDAGWFGHIRNYSPGQCPFDIGTRERELWLTGWSNREDHINGETELREIAVLCTSLQDFRDWKRSLFLFDQDDDYNHTFIRNCCRYFAVMSIDSTRGQRIDDVIYTEPYRGRHGFNIER